VTIGPSPGDDVALSVDVVVPAFNGWELTRACLESLRRQTLAHAVVVADNASTDGTPDRVRESFPEAGVVELTTNQGFAVACNRGVRAGAGDVVVLLNNDVECPPDFLARMVAPLAAADRLGSVAAVLVRPDGGEIDSAGLTADRTFAGFPRHIIPSCHTEIIPFLHICQTGLATMPDIIAESSINLDDTLKVVDQHRGHVRSVHRCAVPAVLIGGEPLGHRASGPHWRRRDRVGARARRPRRAPQPSVRHRRCGDSDRHRSGPDRVGACKTSEVRTLRRV